MKYALITGASKGIGKAIAAELANKGFGLILVARNEILLKQVSAEFAELYKVPIHTFAIDLTEDNAPQMVFDWCMQHDLMLSILVNNAGFGLNGTFEDYPLSDYLQLMRLNMNVVVSLTYLFLPVLKKQPFAFIGNIASTAAYQSVPGLNIYAASKAFVRSFSRGLAYELRKTTVKVSCICPGATDTNFANQANITNEKAIKMAAKFNMNPVVVAQDLVEGLLAGKKEIVPGNSNKIIKYLSNFIPDSFLERSAAGIYGI